MTLERRTKILKRLIKYNECCKVVHGYINAKNDLLKCESYTNCERIEILEIIQHWQEVYRYCEKRYESNLNLL